MPVTTIKGNLFDAPRGLIIHGCNAQGVMGSGVAVYVREKYPQAYKVYRNAHDCGALKLGSSTFIQVEEQLWIVNAVTQSSVGSGVQVDYEAIHKCFDFANYLAEQLDGVGLYGNKPLPLIFPKIGAGRGGGDWNKIFGIICATVPITREMNLYVVDEEPIYTSR